MDCTFPAVEDISFNRCLRFGGVGAGYGVVLKVIFLSNRHSHCIHEYYIQIKNQKGKTHLRPYLY